MGQISPVNTASGVPYYDEDGTVVTRSELEYDDGELAETPLEKALSRALHSSWVRFDYLHWHLPDPGDVLIGAPTTDIGPGYLTKFFSLGSQLFPSGYGRDIDLSRIGLHDISGVQTTIGLPLTFGSIEASGFILQQASDEMIETDIPGTHSGLTLFSLITTTTNGVQTTANNAGALRWSDAFQARITSDVWGTEINFIMDGLEPGEGFKFRPLAGARYLAVQEQMLITGSSGGDTDRISSEVFNNVYGPQIGFRAELVHRWFTVGVEPKVMIGANSYLSSLRTSDLLGDGPTRNKTRDGVFSPIGDLDVYFRIPVNDNFALFASYNLTVISKISRPFDNIVYDVSNGQNNLHLDNKEHSYRLEGYTVGAEIIFW